MSTFEKLKAAITAAENDHHAFHTKGNKTAGTRLRKAYQDIKTLAQQGRKEVTEIKNKAVK